MGLMAEPSASCPVEEILSLGVNMNDPSRHDEMQDAKNLVCQFELMTLP